MSIWIVLLLFAGGFVSGVINAIAGGGTFLTFGVLTLAGLSPISANATSSIVQFPGYITSTLAYWRDIATFWRTALLLCIVSAIGALVGAVLLIQLSNPAFRAMVPWLLLAATALFAFGPRLKPAGAGREPSAPAGAALQFITAIYGGFFGAGMGIMMLAMLGLTQSGDYHRLNALKNLLAIVIAAVAILVFVFGGVIGWAEALVMAPAAALGGWSGVWAARRVPQGVLRIVVICVGVLLALYYFTR